MSVLPRRILIKGGAGFIGSAVVRTMLARTDAKPAIARLALRATVRWYLDNEEWRRTVSSAEHERFQRAYYPKGTAG